MGIGFDLASLPVYNVNSRITGFCMKKSFHRSIPGHPAEQQFALTLRAVVDPKDMWTHGSGAETIHTLTNSFRRREPPHELYIGMDSRVFGESMKDIREAIGALDALDVEIIDLSHPEDDTILKLYARAQDALRWNGDKRQQRSKGAKGGTAKGIAAQAKRDAIMARDAVVRLCAHPKLTWQDCSDILGPLFSVPTLQRNYRE